MHGARRRIAAHPLRRNREFGAGRTASAQTDRGELRCDEIPPAVSRVRGVLSAAERARPVTSRRRGESRSNSLPHGVPGARRPRRLAPRRSKARCRPMRAGGWLSSGRVRAGSRGRPAVTGARRGPDTQRRIGEVPSRVISAAAEDGPGCGSRSGRVGQRRGVAGRERRPPASRGSTSQPD